MIAVADRRDAWVGPIRMRLEGTKCRRVYITMRITNCWTGNASDPLYAKNKKNQLGDVSRPIVTFMRQVT
jgi:hypothetical protein